MTQDRGKKYLKTDAPTKQTKHQSFKLTIQQAKANQLIVSLVDDKSMNVMFMAGTLS